MKAGVGVSCDSLSWQAGLQAATDAALGIPRPRLAIVVATTGYDAPTVLDGVQAVLGDNRVVGASCGGFFAAQGLFEQGVAVMVLGGEELTVETALVERHDEDGETVGRLLGEQLLVGGAETGGILCFPAGFDGYAGRFLDGLYDAAGPDFVYAGSSSGDSDELLNCWQMTEQGSAAKGVAAALLGGCRLAGGVEHGWVPSGAPLVVTRAKGRVVFELDGRAAFDVYAERLGGFAAGSFVQTAMRHPLGVTYGPNRYIVRDPLEIEEGGAIRFVSEVPDKAVAYIMRPQADPDFALAGGLTAGALAKLPCPRFALFSYCVSRSRLLNDRCREEIAALLAPLPAEVPALGILAFGEVGAYADVPQFHNKSISLLMGGE